MISSIRGTVLRLGEHQAVVDVGGVGFAVLITPRHSRTLRLGNEASLLTTLQVREDSLTLFGFESDEELQLFELLLGVSGVGPKSALGVLGEMTASQIASAIASEDDAAFRKVTGIGPKTAKLIVVSLAGKMSGIAISTSITPARASVDGQVLTALTGLGWSDRVAQEALNHAITGADAVDRQSVQYLLRTSLAILGPQLGGGAR